MKETPSAERLPMSCSHSRLREGTRHSLHRACDLRGEPVTRPWKGSTTHTLNTKSSPNAVMVDPAEEVHFNMN